MPSLRTNSKEKLKVTRDRRSTRSGATSALGRLLEMSNFLELFQFIFKQRIAR